jgi:hypothetical protein
MRQINQSVIQKNALEYEYQAFPHQEYAEMT